MKLRNAYLILSLFYASTILSQVDDSSISSTTVPHSKKNNRWHNPEVERVLNLPSTTPTMKKHLNSLERICNAEDVKKLKDVPIRHDREDSETFDYYYAAKIPYPDEPTVIFLQGGPGGPGIVMQGVWKDRNYLHIDSRGIWCNFSTEDVLDYDAMTTWQTVRDIGLVIQELNLKDVIIYGHSFGTMTATVLAHHLEHDLGIIPHTVLLMGVTGHATPSFDSWSVDHFDQWHRLMAEYPKAGLLFANGRLPDVGGTREQWGQYLFDTGNNYRSYGRKLSELFDELEFRRQSGQSGKQIKWFEDFFKQEPRDPYFWREINYFASTRLGCQELHQSQIYSGQRINKQGRMEFVRWPDERDECKDIPLVRPFDAADYQISAPIIYIQGETDPQTPLTHAYYHYYKQESSVRKEFILIERGSHIPLYRELGPCAKTLWNAIKKKESLKNYLDDSGYCLD